MARVLAGQGKTWKMGRVRELWKSGKFSGKSGNFVMKIILIFVFSCESVNFLRTRDYVYMYIIVTHYLLIQCGLNVFLTDFCQQLLVTYWCSLMSNWSGNSWADTWLSCSRCSVWNLKMTTQWIFIENISWFREFTANISMAIRHLHPGMRVMTWVIIWGGDEVTGGPPSHPPHTAAACRGLEVGIHSLQLKVTSLNLMCMDSSTFLCKSLGSRSSTVIFSIKGLLPILCPLLTWCWFRADF